MVLSQRLASVENHSWESNGHEIMIARLGRFAHNRSMSKHAYEGSYATGVTEEYLG